MAAAKTILILESNPWQDLSLNQEIRDLTGVIERARDRDAFKIEQGLAVRTEDLQELMLKHEPQIVHFCGHGSGEDGLVLQDAAQQPVAVTTEALSNLFRLCAEHVDCVVLNACYSEVQAEAIVEHVDYAIGMQQTIRDDAAQHFAQGFYRALGYGKSVEVAYEWGCNAIQLMLSSEADVRQRDSATPQRRRIGRKAVVEGGEQALPEYLKPRLFKRSILGEVKPEEVEQPSVEELAELGQALEQEDALEQYREKVREFLEDHMLSQFEQIRLKQLRQSLGLSEAEAAQVVWEEEAPLQRARDEYREMLEALVEVGAYPFDELTLGELAIFKVQLQLTDDEIAQMESVVLEAAERQVQAVNALHKQPRRKMLSELLPTARPILEAAKKQAQAEEALQKQAQQEQQQQKVEDLLEESTKLRNKIRGISSSEIWHSFEFETARVDSKGEAVRREKLAVQQFVEELGDGVMLEMVRIPAGEFLMGAADGEKHSRNTERPQHLVQVPEFGMGKFAITQSQYQRIMGKNPSNLRGEKLPVEQVSWDDAEAFCRKLSEETLREYRLPSEAEWEYACRAGTRTPFYFGDVLTPEFANLAPTPGAMLFGTPCDVGRFPPNAFGLCDMHGNVAEWCADKWCDNYIDAPINGTAFIGEQGKKYVLRGGSFRVSSTKCRSAFRSAYKHSYRYFDIGFRVACEAKDFVR